MVAFFVLVLPLTISKIIHVYIRIYKHRQPISCVCVWCSRKRALLTRPPFKKLRHCKSCVCNCKTVALFATTTKFHHTRLSYTSGHTEEHLHCQGQTFEARNQIHPFELWIIHFMWVWSLDVNESVQNPKPCFFVPRSFHYTCYSSCNFKETSFECVKSYCLFWVLPHLKYSSILVEDFEKNCTRWKHMVDKSNSNHSTHYGISLMHEFESLTPWVLTAMASV